MLSAREAGRLARQSELAAGSEHAREALRRLAAEGDRGNPAAIDAVWRSWCRVPEDARWELLCRWRDVAELTDAACTAARLQLMPGGETGSRLPRAAFCVRRGLAPADPVERILFYLLTGQTAQASAADPDGVLAARGYAGADDATRRLLRQSLAAGGLDLIRVIAASGTRGRPLAPAEWEYLGARFRERRDWEGLWQLVRDIPLAAAVQWAAAFDDGWRPAGGRDQALFGLLRRADLGGLRAGRDALVERFTRFAVRGGPVRSGALSADGWQLAVVTGSTAGREPEHAVITEFDVDSGAASVVYHVAADPGRVTVGYLDGALAVAIGEGQEGYRDGAQFRLPGGRLVPLPEASRASLEKDVRGPGSLVGRLEPDGVTLHDTREPGLPRLVGRGAIADPDSLCFPGPSAVVAKNALHMRAWRLGDDGLELTAVHHFASRAYSPSLYRPYLVPVRQSTAIAILTWSGYVEFRDAGTLEKVPLPDWLPVGRARQLWASPGGAHWALAGEGSVAVPRDRHPIADVADRPAAGWVPGDLAAARAAVTDPALHPAARPLAGLLRDCLDWHFGADVAVGHSAMTPLAAAPDGHDIAVTAL